MQLLDAPERPDLTGYLWDWFCEMNLDRDAGGMAPGRITSRIMIDWCWATGNELELWERKVIRSIDNAWFASRAEE